MYAGVAVLDSYQADGAVWRRKVGVAVSFVQVQQALATQRKLLWLAVCLPVRIPRSGRSHWNVRGHTAGVVTLRTHGDQCVASRRRTQELLPSEPSTVHTSGAGSHWRRSSRSRRPGSGTGALGRGQRPRETLVVGARAR